MKHKEKIYPSIAKTVFGDRAGYVPFRLDKINSEKGSIISFTKEAGTESYRLYKTENIHGRSGILPFFTKVKMKMSSVPVFMKFTYHSIS